MSAPRSVFARLAWASVVLTAGTTLWMFFWFGPELRQLLPHEVRGVLLAGVAAQTWLAGMWGLRRALQPRAHAAASLPLAVLVVLVVAGVGDSDQARGLPPLFASPMAALAAAPLPVLAQVAGVSPEQMQLRLAEQGVMVLNNASTIAQSVGPDLRQQAVVLAAVLPAPDRRAPASDAAVAAGRTR